MNDGGPAFPALRDYCFQPGMTLRAYIATAALQAMLPVYCTQDDVTRSDLANWSVEYADALIAKLAEEK